MIHLNDFNLGTFSDYYNEKYSFYTLHFQLCIEFSTLFRERSI